jgi:putative Mn2+ efflux pump MntP
MGNIFTLLLVGLSVGLSNFAASIAIGLGGVNQLIRFRIAIVFGLFETIMPIVGLLIGQQFVTRFGGHANIIGGVLLSLAGLYLLVNTLRNTTRVKAKVSSYGVSKLLVAGFSLSIDNLIVGFGLGTRHQSLWLSVIVIGITSVTLALLGLELGNRLGTKIEAYSETISGLILILVGIGIALKLL